MQTQSPMAQMLTAAILLAGCQGAIAKPFDDALTQGRTSLDARLRYEQVDQDVAGREIGQSLSLRARLAYMTDSWHAWRALGEFEGVWSLSDYDGYNSLRNGAADKGVIADPRGNQLNQAWVRYDGLQNTVLTYGRQRLVYDNARFIGDVGWRQNEQTFTGFSVRHASSRGGLFEYAWLSTVETILFRSQPLQAHLLNLQQDFRESLRLGVYAYLLDFEAAAPADSQTLGIRASGKHGRLRYALEFAQQSDYAESSNASTRPDATYYSGELGATFSKLELSVGYEVLGGDQNPSTEPFTTPLATLHKFQGWADVFLTTPDAGVRDAWIEGSFALKRNITLTAVFHRFDADAGTTIYGNEVDAMLSAPLASGLSGLLKYANYQADGFGVDTQRIWGQLTYCF